MRLVNMLAFVLVACGTTAAGDFAPANIVRTATATAVAPSAPTTVPAATLNVPSTNVSTPSIPSATLPRVTLPAATLPLVTLPPVTLPPASPPATLDPLASPTFTTQTLPQVTPPTTTLRTFDPLRFIGQGDAYNCGDFASQAQAQAVLRADPRDPNRLDADRDGIACESNPGPFDRVRVPRL